ncbi:MAG: ISLre2 family transposase [Bacillota bacterium]
MVNVRCLADAVLHLTEGFSEVVGSVSSFEELEERVQGLVQRVSLMIMAEVLEEIDKKLLAERDQKTLENVGLRKRSIVTSFGELSFRRRLYRETKTQECRFLLDETLDLGERKQISPRMSKIMIKLGTEMPFRRASRLLEYIAPGVHAMTVWSAVQRAGRMVAEEAKASRTAVFKHGEIPLGKKTTRELFIEADGVMIRQQRAKACVGEVKLVVGYEGKEGKPRRLVNRHSVAGLTNGEAIWEEASVLFGSEWALDGIEEVRIGGDGARWIKEGGKAFFPQASYHLDRFHLRKGLTEALSFCSKCYNEAAEGIATGDREVVLSALEQALKQAPGRPARKRIRQLRKYLLENWEGIASLPENERLGTIEGQVRHTITRRMKRIGARWTPEGADRMARLLAVRANGKLGDYNKAGRNYRQDIFKRIMPPTAIAKSLKAACGEYVDWLAAEVPALQGPFAGKPWVKHVLRELTSVRWSLQG